MSPSAPWIFRERRSAPAVPAFVCPPPLQQVACTLLPAVWEQCTCITRWAGVVSAPTLLLLFDLLQQVVSTPLPGSLGCGVPAPDDPFCFYQNLCGCKALPAVWVRLKAAATCLCLSLRVFFRYTPQPARESRLGAPCSLGAPERFDRAAACAPDVQTARLLLLGAPGGGRAIIQEEFAKKPTRSRKPWGKKT